MLFSIYVLNDVIPKRDKESFRKSVLVCQYICKRIISENDVAIAHWVLIQFCKHFEILHEKEKVTPNMHQCASSRAFKGLSLRFWTHL